ncbi:uracil-DNA glycosylase [Secundilactobacillus paracollinoides]|uniref:Uracil-DNA glycosylase n=1 Tax=Secundilactobacillus paracollinoides TaxID=240427 RepID=A0A1B2IYF6_9LACO|nr:uracil-DNA glycosylase [Secundilactobacillus paracollinoides]ANZ61152.1 uracil-DNA glycosylase [Secundilactobacillus paracollinoides]ANZ64454.1 uracil-DNA glycosylase [Secundilactobacillus paracollinoides]ANZ67073.1 uracil-DNA glycosylase [Secundilactobacillus paracollinoides]KRL76070.1 uracil-DNA glycosylase family protein [Secundilactobacillus paracollinoides DSM 15502 = JCM 11969]
MMMPTFLTATEMTTARQLIADNPRLEGFVPGEGSLTPAFTLVSEAPGRVEAQTGHGFMGPAGQKLNEWLAFLDVTRNDIYMTGAVRGRPFTETNGRKRDRKPSKKEEAAFAPLLDGELARLPKDHDLLVPLGNTGLQRLLGNQVKIGDVHGRCFSHAIRYWDGQTYQWTEREYRICAMYHPSYVRRFPKMQATASADLAALKAVLD